MALRAYYSQENNFGVTDRLEIHEDGFSGTAIELYGRAPSAFDFEHREITSEQKEYLSIFENQIIMGVLDFYAWIDTTAKETLVTDIADAPTKQFKIEWKRNGNTVWQGFPYGRIVEYPERPQYNVKIQFRDFEILKGLDYPLEDDRQKIITTFSEIFSQLGFSQSIKTHTSWQCEGTTVSDDFLNQVYHDTYALRQYANDEDGYSNDQNISYYDALLRTADPMLVVYQWKGFNIFQISDCKSQPMKYAVYNSSGTQVTSTTVDRSYTLSNSSSNQPSVKTITNNTSYPALKRAIYEFKHQSGGSEFEFKPTKVGFRGDPDTIDMQGAEFFLTSQPFQGNGDETFNFSASYYSYDPDGSPFAGNSRIAVTCGDYIVRANDWTTVENSDLNPLYIIGSPAAQIDTSTGEITDQPEYDIWDPMTVWDMDNMPVRLTTTGVLPGGFELGTTYYIVDAVDTNEFYLSGSPNGSPIVPTDTGTGTHNIYDITIRDKPIQISWPTQFNEDRFFYFTQVNVDSGLIPDGADGDLEITLLASEFTSDHNIEWARAEASIINPTQAGESIEFRLIQDEDYSESLRLPDSYYGDGPYAYSRSSYRTSSTLGDITTGWRRRGKTTYIPYSRLKLNEVLDYQRVRQLKKTFEINGEIEPDEVAVYESDPFMYVGGRYNGRWRLIGVKVEENTDG